MNIPADVKKIMEQLNKKGFEAYAVGGCVRDTILGKVPGDWDITTDARPADVKALFRRTIDTGTEHGTVTVMIGKTGYEITTYRVDSVYSDGRHPDSVTFTPSLAEDLKRRDFTMNAMAYSERDGLKDLFGGQEDIRCRVIRCVGNPDERFQEDALRILRAVRFSAQLGFEIEEETWEALKRHAPNLVHVSKERIFAELNKTLLSDHPEKLKLVFDAGMAPFVSPSFAGLQPAETVSLLPKKKYVRWAAVLAGTSPEHVRKLLRELKSDNETTDGAADLTALLKKRPPENKPAVRKLLSRTGPERYDELMLLYRTGFGQNMPENPEEGKRLLEDAERMKEEVMRDGDCRNLKMLSVTGKDLMEAGVRPGKEIGETLERLLEVVFEHPEYNTKEKLLSLL
jgi:tRNA nucleotidyltransferase (CCA-adding enzyme)